MTLQKRTSRRCPIVLSISLCFSFGCFCFAVVIHQYSPSSICIPLPINEQRVDDQENWKYQNSITGEWFIWNSSNQQHQWTVKWLNSHPTSSLGVIVYLTARYEIGSLNQSLVQLSRLLTNNPRPVVIFHEGDLTDDDLQQSFARTIGPRFPLAFERIQFGSRVQTISKVATLGYLHMCRFFTLMLPNHPLLTLFTFYWRMDAHSFIFAPNPIRDPFEIMQNRHSQLAYVMANEDDIRYVADLWSFFQQFLRDHCLKPSKTVRQTQTTLFGGYSFAIIFTNFAIANVSIFRDHPMIRTWLKSVDRNGGIYRHRWGDAPLHTLAITQFLTRNDIVRFRYFGYMHRQEYVCAHGTRDKQCQEQAQPFRTDPSVEYRNYDDGCFPSTRNPLCHYYPEIRL